MYSRSNENNRENELTKENLNEFNNEIRNRETYLINQIQPYIDIPKAVFIGMTGSGKSSIICRLSNMDLKIKRSGESIIMRLEGEGVGNDLFSCTSIPVIRQETNRKYVFIDCPGFEDVEGYLNEIKNAFSIDNIFKKYPNKQNKFKIIIVVAQDEFDNNRGKKMVDSFLRLEQMFPIGDKLYDNIGLIITKGEPGIDCKQYLLFLKERIKNTINPPKHIERVCDFFLGHLDHTFVFPKPSFQDENKQYNFEDHQRLLNFLGQNLLINPDHKITLSTEAILKLNIIRKDHSAKLKSKVQNLCNMIYNQFLQETTSIELQKWYDIIINLFKANIKKSSELDDFLKHNVPKYEQYHEFIKEIAEYELFDEFIDKMIYEKLDTSCLNEVLQAWCTDATFQLHQFVMNAKDSEMTKEELAKQEELQKQSEEKMKEFQRITDENEKKRQDMEKKYVEEIKRQQELHKENMNQIKQLQNDLDTLISQNREHEKNIRNLQRQLQEERNKPRGSSSSRGCLLI